MCRKETGKRAISISGVRLRDAGEVKMLCSLQRAAHQTQYIALYYSCLFEKYHSHSMVAGGLPEISNTTRLMPRTSLMMRLDTLPNKA